MELDLELARREAYPPAMRSSSVRRIETHLSWVYVLERDVFKVKKPVDLGFVDFTTLERRKAACDAEVKLNSRLAAGVYLGVVPITRTGGAIQVAGEGTPIEWAVHMRRLPDERCAHHLLAAGELHGGHIDRIAEHIASFHARARCDLETTRFGAPDQIRRNVLENFAQTSYNLHQVLSDAEADELTTYQAWFLAQNQRVFLERMAAGRIRDTHGDLRLEHVYLSVHGEPTIIDCIEFNDRFRYADVCADIAFLSMDLAVHGRVDFAERLLARYAREADDYDLYALVDFYESYRAFVRGKVAMMLSEDEHAPEALRVRSRAEARRHFLLALAAGRPSALPPFVLAIGGLIASGKSTVAERLGEQLSVPVVSSDRTRKHLAGVSVTQSIAEGKFVGAYAPERSEEVYTELVRRAAVVLGSGRPVILDASFRSAHERQRVRRLAREHGVPFVFAECRCSESAALSRLAMRQPGHASDARVDLYDAFVASYEPVRISPSEHVIVDTELPLERNIAELQRRVASAERHLLAV